MILIIFGAIIYCLLVLDCSLSDYSLSKKIKGKFIGEERGKIIEKRNKDNLILSCIFIVISFILVQLNSTHMNYVLLGFNGYRFFSRNIEIMIAFGHDVFSKEPPKSEEYLDNFKRIRLAIISYLEIFLYSSSFYVVIMNDYCINTFELVLKSILMSLSVGTLTNVGFSQNLELLSLWVQIVPFFQVFTSLSLIVLSLTMYVSRGADFYKKK